MTGIVVNNLLNQNDVTEQASTAAVVRRCANCGSSNKELKRGWTNDWYCSENCERKSVSSLHGSMPGAGPVPRHNWVPSHIGNEISRRWEDA